MARNPALDGIRGIAIAFVMLRHAWPQVFGAANFVGVELFFVLSGFLITTLLVRDLDGQVASLRRFYWNRAVRLLPAMLVLVAVVCVVAVLWPADDRWLSSAGLVAALTYTADLPVFEVASQPPDLRHLWTLAVEEQFYLLWPALLLVAHRRRQIPALLVVALLAAALLLILSALWAGEHGRLVELYRWPLPWALPLVAGAALGVGLLRPWSDPWVAGLAVAALVAVAFVPSAKEHVAGYVIGVPLVAVGALALVGNAIGERPLALLSWAPLRSLGTVSYGAYLWSLPMSHWLPPAAGIAGTVLAATASWWLLERLVLRLKRPAPLTVATAS